MEVSRPWFCISMADPLLAGQVGAGRNAHAFLFLVQAD